MEKMEDPRVYEGHEVSVKKLTDVNMTAYTHRVNVKRAHIGSVEVIKWLLEHVGPGCVPSRAIHRTIKQLLKEEKDLNLVDVILSDSDRAKWTVKTRSNSSGGYARFMFKERKDAFTFGIHFN